MKRINPNLYPHDGYYFVDRDGARIFGDTWNGVIARVKKYRQRAGYEVGDVAAEVINQACARNPGYCSENNEATEAQLKVTSLKTIVLKWLAEMRKHRDELNFSGWETIRARASICAKCQKNIPLPSGCASCNAVVREARKELLGDRPIDGRLNACSVLGEDPAVATYFERQAVDNGELPLECWRKRTL